MRKGFICFLVATIVSCKNTPAKNKDVKMPAQPASVDAVKASLQHREFNVAQVGTVNFFDTNKLEWGASSEDTSKFYKDFVAERKNFVLHFINDTAVQVQDDKKAIAANYHIEKDTAGMLLKIQYADSSFSFNPGETSIMTYTYKIRGADGNGLLLETPRELNRKKVVVLMKEQ